MCVCTVQRRVESIFVVLHLNVLRLEIQVQSLLLKVSGRKSTNKKKSINDD